MKLYKKPKRRFVGIAGGLALLAVSGVVVACPSSLNVFADIANENDYLANASRAGEFAFSVSGAPNENDYLTESEDPAGFGFTVDDGMTRVEDNANFGFTYDDGLVSSAAEDGNADFNFNVIHRVDDEANDEVHADFTVIPIISIGTGAYDATTGYADPIQDINIEADASVNTGFAVENTEFKVRSNNPSGFSVYVEGGDLINNQNANAKISPIQSTSGIEADRLNPNTWGFNLVNTKDPNADTSKFYSPLSKTPAYSVPTFSGEANLKLTIGTKVDINTTPGTYSNVVKVSAVVNPVTLTEAFSE